MSDTLNNIGDVNNAVETVRISGALSNWYDNPFFVGAAGAVVGMLVPSEKVTFFQRCGMMVGGTMMAAFVSPLIAKWTGIEDSAYANAVTFFVGLVGMQIARGIVKYAEEFARNPKEFLKNHKPWGKK